MDEIIKIYITVSVSFRFMGRESWNALIRKSMITAVHPVEDRYLNVREMMHLMGLPHDFQVGNGHHLITLIHAKTQFTNMQ